MKKIYFQLFILKRKFKRNKALAYSMPLRFKLKSINYLIRHELLERLR